MTTINPALANLKFEEFKVYIEQYPHITEDAEALYVAAGGKPPKKKETKEKGE